MIFHIVGGGLNYGEAYAPKNSRYFYPSVFIKILWNHSQLISLRRIPIALPHVTPNWSVFCHLLFRCVGFFFLTSEPLIQGDYSDSPYPLQKWLDPQTVPMLTKHWDRSINRLPIFDLNFRSSFKKVGSRNSNDARIRV